MIKLQILETFPFMGGTRDEKSAALMLIVKAYKQNPTGSLPTDPRVLAALAEMTPDEWAQVSDGALTGWVEHADGRLYHPMVTADVWRGVKARESGRRGGQESGKVRALESNNNRRPVQGPSKPVPVPAPVPDPSPGLEIQISNAESRGVQGGEQLALLPGATGKRSRKKAPEIPLPDGWKPSDQWRRDIGAERVRLRMPPLDMEAELAAFTAHAREHDRRCSSWDWAFRRWCNHSKAARDHAQRVSGKPARASRQRLPGDDFSKG